MEKKASNSERMPSKAASKVLCRYFMNGACREKEHCRYSHDFHDQPSMVCTYYQQGSCSYGENCRYDHIKPDRSRQQQIAQSKPLLPHPILPLEQCNPASAACAYLLQMNKVHVTPHLVTLRKGDETALSSQSEISAADFKVKGLPSKISAEDWVKASEFIPGQKWKTITGPSSYSEAAQSGISLALNEEAMPQDFTVVGELCPFAAHGICNYGSSCLYVHGDICELCGKAVLTPSDEMQNQQHMKECMREHESSMEAAFAAQVSRDKVCGICMEVVWEKQPLTAQRFGILSDCSHIFCLGCIRKWRATDEYETQVIRACPECRTKSDFVIPSKYWVDNKDDKIRLMEAYKMALSKKPCIHFQHGRGECPFNDKCFYEHSYPDGRKASPAPVRRCQNADGVVNVVHKPLLWDFLNVENERRNDFTNFLLADSNDNDVLDLASLQLHSFSNPTTTATTSE